MSLWSLLGLLMRSLYQSLETHGRSSRKKKILLSSEIDCTTNLPRKSEFYFELCSVMFNVLLQSLILGFMDFIRFLATTR